MDWMSWVWLATVACFLGAEGAVTSQRQIQTDPLLIEDFFPGNKSFVFFFLIRIVFFFEVMDCNSFLWKVILSPPTKTLLQALFFRSKSGKDTFCLIIIRLGVVKVVPPILHWDALRLIEFDSLFAL